MSEQIKQSLNLYVITQIKQHTMKHLKYFTFDFLRPLRFLLDCGNSNMDREGEYKKINSCLRARKHGKFGIPGWQEVFCERSL